MTGIWILLAFLLVVGLPLAILSIMADRKYGRQGEGPHGAPEERPRS